MSQRRYRRPLNTPEFRGARPRCYSREVRVGISIERDVEVPTRFGFNLYADLFRPEPGDGPVPVLVAWTPYGKHDPSPLATLFPTCGVKPEWTSDLTIFEAPDPAYWCMHGYAVLAIDIPGVWFAQSPAHFCDPQEAEAFADAIEWAGTQRWSNGRVGLSGVSYLTVMQWRVAALNPPHLAAINPWEGWSDTYREVVRHGGIPETSFWPYIQTRWGASDQVIEDLWAETAEHPLFDSFWQDKAAPLEQIKVPAYVVASWSDHALHTRGTLEGFRRIGSSEKWLEVHGRKKWAHYYDPESVERQRAFWDHHLKGITAAPAWPRVCYEERERHGLATWCASSDWPLPEVRQTRFYLDAATSRLVSDNPPAAGHSVYDSLAEDGEAVFDLTFAEETSVVGHGWLHLHFAPQASDDADIFVVIEKLDHEGRFVPFSHYAVFEDGPVALGWLRLSHRELDTEQSTPFLPVLAHRRELKVRPGERVVADIEILPSGTRFAAGETLRLRIRGRDGRSYPKPMLYARHEDTVNIGAHQIFAGGETASWLQLPLVRQILAPVMSHGGPDHG